MEEGCPKAAVTVDVVQEAKDKTVVVFFVPGAYTPTCSERHAPEFIQVNLPFLLLIITHCQYFCRSATLSPLPAHTRLAAPASPLPPRASELR